MFITSMSASSDGENFAVTASIRLIMSFTSRLKSSMIWSSDGSVSWDGFISFQTNKNKHFLKPLFQNKITSLSFLSGSTSLPDEEVLLGDVSVCENTTSPSTSLSLP